MAPAPMMMRDEGRASGDMASLLVHTLGASAGMPGKGRDLQPVAMRMWRVVSVCGVPWGGVTVICVGEVMRAWAW